MAVQPSLLKSCFLYIHALKCKKRKYSAVKEAGYQDITELAIIYLILSPVLQYIFFLKSLNSINYLTAQIIQNKS